MSTENDCEKEETKALRQDAVRQRFFVGFGKTIVEEEKCSLANPMINEGFNGLLESIDIVTRWWEYRLFIGKKPIFRYKSLNRKRMTVKRFLFVCWVNVA